MKSLQSVIQIDSVNDELRNSLWNALDVLIWSDDNFLWTSYGYPGIRAFSKILWFHYFKQPIDTRPHDNSDKLTFIRDYFFGCEWYEVYDFIEFVLSYYNRNTKLVKLLNNLLERELSGYRIIDNLIVEITNEQEVKLIKEALADDTYKGVTSHLKRALELLSDKTNPDYRNSIKESISAVESMSKIVTNNKKASLGDALKVLEKGGKLHQSLKRGFSNLYGYTSDEKGIRHSMLEEPSLSIADAKYFLLSCTSFVNYLKSKI